MSIHALEPDRCRECEARQSSCPRCGGSGYDPEYASDGLHIDAPRPEYWSKVRNYLEEKIERLKEKLDNE